MTEFLNKLELNKQRPIEFWAKLINSLDNHQVPPSELFDDLDDNVCDANDLLPNTFVYPSQIYYFDYQTKTPSIYQSGKTKIPFVDRSPLVLVFKNAKDYIRGINLNLCTNDLKGLILNIFVQMDKDYFNGGYVKLCQQKKIPLSDILLDFMTCDSSDKINIKAEDEIKKELTKIQPGVDYNFIFRTYTKTGIMNVQLVAPYMWQYLPGITYGGKMKGSVINKLQEMTGLNRVKLH